MMSNYLLAGTLFVLVLICVTLLDTFLKTKVELIHRSTVQGVVLQKRVIKSKILFLETEYLAVTVKTQDGKMPILKGSNRLFSRHFKICNLESLNKIEENKRYSFECYTGKFNVPHIYTFKLLS